MSKWLSFIPGVKCEKNVKAVKCLYDPCITTQCLNIPNATCVPYTCGQCSARFFNTSGQDVTSSCSKYKVT